MARVPMLAAGGIVLRREQPPRIAVVRLRKRDEWVLPKGKLDDGETPRAAARREVLEETGHDVTVHEFLGTLVYDSGGRSKVVHYWSMEASGEQTRELMNDIRAVEWLPLNEALLRLSRGSERAFLETVGPLAVNGLARRLRAKAPIIKEPGVKAPERKRRGPAVIAPEPAPVEPSQVVPQPPQPEFVLPAAATEASLYAASEVVNGQPRVEAEIAAETALAVEPDCAISEPMNGDDKPAVRPDGHRRSLAERLRDWLGRAA